jgi:uncharacterized protein
MIQRFLYLILVLCISCGSGPVLERDAFVRDMEDLFTAEQIDRLSELARIHEQRTTNEILILTTPSLHGHEYMRDHAVEIGNTAGVGKRDKNNGVVIVVSRTLRETFIATGHGTEQMLPDEQVQQIVDSLMIPHFKEDRYFEGTYAGAQAVVGLLEER